MFFGFGNQQFHIRTFLDTFVDGNSVKSDPNGSYTGKGTDPFSVPVQDQDDL